VPVPYKWTIGRPNAATGPGQPVPGPPGATSGRRWNGDGMLGRVAAEAIGLRRPHPPVMMDLDYGSGRAEPASSLTGSRVERPDRTGTFGHDAALLRV
jgi:hypothetical protein